jgi:hypothetical protein
LDLNISELASIAEIIGGAAVIVSIVYLAIQIRENAIQTTLGSAISLNHLINEAFDPIYNNDRNISIWVDGIAAPSQLNSQDQAIFGLFMARLVNVLLTALMHNDHNILEMDVAKTYIGSLNSILNSPGGKYWLTEMAGDDLLSDSVRQVLENSTLKQDSLTFRGNSE